MASKVSSLLSTSLEFNWSMRVGTLISGRLNPLRNKDFICCCDDKDCFKGSALEEEPVPEEVTVIDDGWQALRVQNPGVGGGAWSGLGEKWGFGSPGLPPGPFG
ncbi:hypothetical protein AAC387_Pa02g1135 [Persea americana]